MGMNFSPMYQPVSTKTIKADGDLNINPYDLLATDVKCDTVEASEFVGGVGNFNSLISAGDISLNGNLFVKATTTTTKRNNDIEYATVAAQSVNESGGTITVNGYSKNITMSYPYQLYPGVCIESANDFTDTVPSPAPRTLTLKIVCTQSVGSISNSYWIDASLYVNGSRVDTMTGYYGANTPSGHVVNSKTYTVNSGDTLYVTKSAEKASHASWFNVIASIDEGEPYYIGVV